MKNYSLLITSCDSFEDVWSPFFKLYKKYWNDEELPIYIITEKKEASYPSLGISSTMVEVGKNTRLTWSEALSESLNKVKTDLVLLHLDDCFITSEVNVGFIDNVANIMLSDTSIDAVYLTHSGPKSCEFENGKDLLKVKKFSSYKVSTMSCLWRKDVLQSLLKPEENAWMFEIFGTKRAHLNSYNFLKVANKNLDAIKYINTGITKGKWNPDVVAFFEDNDIIMDFKIRGFFKVKNNFLVKLTTLQTLIKDPLMFIYHFFYLPPLARFKNLWH